MASLSHRQHDADRAAAMTGLEVASLVLYRIDIAAAIDRGNLRLAEHMLADYPRRVLHALRRPL